MKDQSDCFLQNGYCSFYIPDLIDLSKFNVVNVEQFETLPLDAWTPYEEQEIKRFVDFVSNEYVATLFPNYVVDYYAVWDGVDLGSAEWHNDSDELFHFNCLYYFDDTGPAVGGNVEFRWPNGGYANLYPKAGTLVFINQDLKFEHKANRSTAPRRVASIEYRIL